MTQFLELLRAGLWGVDANPDNFQPGYTNWKVITYLAFEHAVNVIIADALEALPKECCPPEDIILRFAMSRTKTLQRHKLLSATINQIVKAFDEHGVHSVLLKGQAVAQNYRNPLSRICGDIDLYTGLEGYDKAVEIIASFNHGKEHVYAEECLYHMHTCLNDIDVEIHRQASFIHGKRLNANFQEWTRESIDQLFGTGKLETWDNDGTAIALPTPTFNAFYVLHHAVRHMTTEGIVFRQICDWMMILHKYHSQIDADLLRRKLKELRMVTVWEEFSRLAVNFLGLPKEALPIPIGNLEPTHVTYKLLDHIFIPGNFVDSEPKVRKRSNMPYLKWKWRSFTYQANRLLKLFRLFPAYAATYMWHWTTGALVRAVLRRDR